MRLLQQLLYFGDLILRQQLRAELVDAQLLRHGCCHVGAVARQHDGFLHACGPQRGNGLSRVGLDDVGDDDVPDVLAVKRHVQDGAGQLALVAAHAAFAHQLVVAHQHHVLVDLRAHAVAALLLHVVDALLVDGPRVRLLHRQRDGVVRVRLGVRGDGQQAVGVDARLRVDGHHVERAVGERAGLVEHDGLGAGQRLQVVAALHENAQARGAADAAEERQRHADDERARARHHEEDEPALHPFRPALAQQQWRYDGQEHRDAHHGRGVVAREAGDEILGLGLLLGRVLHELEDAAHGGLAEGLGHAHGDEAGHVDAARDDLVALAHFARHRLAGEGRGVQLGRAGQHHAVERHAFAGFHDDLVAHGHLVGVHLHELPVALHVGEVGRDVHHVGDGFTALAYGVALEQLAHLVEQHDGRAFGHVRVAVGEQHQRERADGGHAHEEVLVEHLAVADVLRRAQQHVVAGDEIGDEEQRELRP